MDWKKIRSQKYVWYYGGIFLLYMLVSIWIYAVNDGNYPIETCFVRYGGTLFVVVLCHYLFYVRKIRPRWRLWIKIGIVLIAEGLASILAVKLFAITGILKGFSKRYVLLAWILLSIAFIIYLYMKQIIDDNKALALTVFLMGSLFTFTLPVTSGIAWDDQTHYQKVLQIANLGETSFSRADELVITQVYNGGVSALFETGAYGKFKKEINSLYKQNERTQIPYEPVQIGVAITYLPMVFFVLIGRGLSLPYTLLFMFGKWANVILYSVLIYIAFKQLKSGKLIVFFISMFPTTLFLMANYAYDTWGIGWTILGFSYFIGALQDDTVKIGYQTIIKMSITFLLGYSAKPIYFCLILLLLCVKREKLAEGISILKYRMIVIMLTLMVLFSFVAPFLMSGTGGNDMRGGTDVDSARQIAYILANPLEYTHTLLHFLKDYWSVSGMPVYISHFAYLGIYMNGFYFVFIFSIMVILLDKAKCDVKITSIGNRIWAFFLAFSASVFVATALYVAYTPVGLGTVNGCQPRYLLPILFVTHYFIGDYRLIKPFDRFINRKILLICTVLVYVVYASYGLCTLCINLY